MLLSVNWLDPKSLIDTFGTWGLWLVIFIESGIFPAPLPGDSLLFIAGLFSSTSRNSGDPHLNLWLVTVGSFIAAVLGAQIGYYIGKFFGHRFFKEDARFFKLEYLRRAHVFFERRGMGAVIIGRFIPFVRSIVPVVAGASTMKDRTFFAANVIGAAIWAVGVSLLGYTLGTQIGADNVDKYLLPIIGVIIVLSLIPPFLEWRKHKREQAAAATNE
jgi:membrane-associated protein